MTATTPRKRRAAATPAAEPAQPLADRILAAIASAHSRKPANADDVLAVIGGDAPDFWRAVEQLKCECRINVAIIRRANDAKEWMAIWPTGTPVAHRTWKDLNAAGAFATLPAACMPKRMPTTPDLERDPRPDLRKITREAEGKIVPISADQRRDRIAQLAAGRTLANGIKFADVAADLGISVEGVRYLTKRMGEGARVAFGQVAGEFAHRIYDPAAQASEEIAAGWPLSATDTAPAIEPRPDLTVEPADQAIAEPNAEPIAEPSPEEAQAAPARINEAFAALAAAFGEMEVDGCGSCDGLCGVGACRERDPAPFATRAPSLHTPPRVQPDRVTFALWDDGGLSIYDGDDLLQLPPADTARLARLLGVPGNPVPAQEQRA